MTGVGGLSAFVTPLLTASTPIFVIYFLRSLSKAFLFKYDQNYHQQCYEFLEFSEKILLRRVCRDHQKECGFVQLMKDLRKFKKYEAKKMDGTSDDKYSKELRKD